HGQGAFRSGSIRMLLLPRTTPRVAIPLAMRIAPRAFVEGRRERGAIPLSSILTYRVAVTRPEKSNHPVPAAGSDGAPVPPAIRYRTHTFPTFPLRREAR
ncbi:MAG: hypothetical protein ACRDHN_17680, partial [Thermomicrobiales bacterium]